MPYDAPVELRVKAHTSPIAFQPWDYIYTQSLSHSYRVYGKQSNADTHYTSYRMLIPTIPATRRLILTVQATRRLTQRQASRSLKRCLGEACQVRVAMTRQSPDSGPSFELVPRFQTKLTSRGF